MKRLYIKDLHIRPINNDTIKITKRVKVLLDSWGNEGYKDVYIELSKNELKTILSLFNDKL